MYNVHTHAHKMCPPKYPKSRKNEFVYSPCEDSIAASATRGAKLSTSPLLFGTISPYPPAFRLYKILISPVFHSQGKKLLVKTTAVYV